MQQFKSLYSDVSYSGTFAFEANLELIGLHQRILRSSSSARLSKTARTFRASSLLPRQLYEIPLPPVLPMMARSGTDSSYGMLRGISKRCKCASSVFEPLRL